ncbi:MAG: T9SS type B sorting domain-containing protein [Bacteroidota bacterium]
MKNTSKGIYIKTIFLIVCGVICFNNNIYSFETSKNSFNLNNSKYIYQWANLETNFNTSQISMINSNTCPAALPFCTSNSYLFPASTNVPDMGAVGCLYTTPNPAWYWMEIGNSGNIDIHMSSGGDVDFICWGPFSSLSAACSSDLMSNTGVDCSYSTAAEEDCNIVGAVTGQVYVLLITNYANMVTNISFNQTGGSGSTNCGIIAPPITNNGPLCVGQTLNLTVTNPTAGASYSWTGPGGWTSNVMNPSIPNITTAQAGTYSMTITVGTQVSPPVTTQVSVYPIPTVTASALPSTICSGSSSSLTATGALDYVWSNALGTTNPVSVNPTTTTTYTVTGSTNGCSNTASVTVNVNPLPTVTATATPSTICVGGTSSLSVTGADSYTWSDGLGTGNPVSVSPTTTTTYTVTGTTNGCSSTASVTVNVTPLPTITASASPSAICIGGTSSLTASGGTTYAWSDGLGSGNPVSVTPATTTTYTVTGTTSGCSNTATVTVNVNPIPTITASALPTSICSGGTSSLTASGGTSYTWSDGLGSGNPINVSPATTTTYTVTGTTSGCSNTATVTVTVNSSLVVTATALPSSICIGGTSSLTASGGVSYAWSNGLGSGNPVSVTPATTTTYTVTGTSGDGCTSTAQVTVTISPNATATITGANPICTGGSTTLTASGGASYLWSNTLTTAAISVNPATTTTYTVTVTSASGCTGTASHTVTVNPLPTPSITGTSSICNGGSASLTASGGGTYLWSTNATTPTISINPTATTTYTVTVTSANGCTATASQVITENPMPTPSIAGTFSICNGASTTLTASGGSTYLWSNTLTTPAITVNPTVTTTYTVTATSVSGCTATISQVVTVNQLPNPTITGTFTICSGVNTTLTASGGSTYLWNTAATTAAITVNPTITTTYTVTVTTASGCSATATQIVTANPLPIPVITGVLAICPEDTTTLTASGGVGYNWSNGPIIATNTVSPLVSTTYTVTVTNQNGCTQTTSAFVTRNNNPVISVIDSTIETCTFGNGSLHLIVTTGIEPYHYNWSNGGGDSSTISNLSAGTFTVTVTDNAGCTVVQSIPISNSPAPILTLGNVIDDHCNSAIGEAMVIATGGTGNYSYSWNTVPAQVNLNANHLLTGTYLAIVNDDYCSDSVIVTIGNIPGPTADFEPVPYSALSSNPEIRFQNQSTGQTSNYWSFGDGEVSSTENPVHFYNNPQSYTVVLEVVDDFLCTDTASHVVTIIEDINIFIPNTFTPNGDGINEVFRPYGSGYSLSGYAMNIYNRWGEMVFYSNVFEKGWDGKISGEKLNINSVFSYRIVIYDLNGKDYIYTGHVTMLGSTILGN